MVCRFGEVYYIAFEGFILKTFQNQLHQRCSLKESHVSVIKTSARNYNKHCSKWFAYVYRRFRDGFNWISFDILLILSEPIQFTTVNNCSLSRRLSKVKSLSFKISLKNWRDFNYLFVFNLSDSASVCAWNLLLLLKKHFSSVSYKIFYFISLGIFLLYKTTVTISNCSFVSSLSITDDIAV